MWVSKKKLKEIEDKYAEQLDKYQHSIDTWCERENKKFLASIEKTEAWQAKAEQFNKDHHALVEKFLTTMVECLKR